ncbi:Gfo/Idh/MocA family oxidoreductase [Brevibacillus sp. SYP-B805]|uniref:Gfo/Idh/MocA family protein n=1 Tax=Brevibacillus sp. SYP-B805 TaxID=1578199 RepID=UPI0013EAE5CD|nr:Gfo/Idh/MocA family oxidoreductase [Brevibacillus sp. SYP-B805]NGQ95771.1 Gfo/Idh/MocA family oxidoreductase [Brevibacillus sp. SYP-B805]
MRVILLGYGAMGRLHLAAYRRMKDVEVVAIFSTSGNASIDGIPVYRDLDECVRVEADAVDICLPTFLHKIAFVKALEAGKHIFLEKPVASSLSDAKEMLDLARKTERKIMVGQVLRYFPEYQKLREQLDPEKPVSALLSRRAKLPEGKHNWFLDRQKSGGVILDLSLHDIDFLRWTLGPVTRILAQTDQEYRYALITMRHKNKSISRIEASWRYDGGFTMEAELAQEGKLLTYHSRYTIPLHVHSLPEEKDAVEVPAIFLHEDPYYRELADFVHAVRQDTDVSITLEDAYQSTCLALLALHSADTRKPVTVEEGGKGL